MRPRRLKNEINVVPYIDVMLVLLVIFMVTAPLVPTASIDLPTVGKGSTPPVAPLEIMIRADRTLSMRDRALGGGEVTLGRLQLAQMVREMQAKHPDQSVLIAGDKGVPYGEVLAVMDELQKQNVRKIGLLVTPLAARPGEVR